MDKVAKGLDRLQQQASVAGGRLDIGTIAIGCALGYLDFRYPDLAWRDSRPQLAAWYSEFETRPSMAATRPHE
jgi:glutathione S-transferase